MSFSRQTDTLAQRALITVGLICKLKLAINFLINPLKKIDDDKTVLICMSFNPSAVKFYGNRFGLPGVLPISENTAMTWPRVIVTSERRCVIFHFTMIISFLSSK